MDRTAIFMDGGYLDKLVEREFGRVHVDLGKLATELAGGKPLLRAYYYHCPPYQGDPPTEEESQRVAQRDRFYAALHRLPRFQVRLGKLAKRGEDGGGRPIFLQKRVDVMLAVDMVQLSLTRQISHVVLLAGDSDFVPAIDVVKQNGVSVVLWHGAAGSYHRELWEACDERMTLSVGLIERVKRG